MMSLTNYEVWFGVKGANGQSPGGFFFCSEIENISDLSVLDQRTKFGS